MIALPVASPPVKETRSTRGSSESGAPASAPAPSTRLPTPAGRPASASSFIRWIAVCGVSSLGLSTNVLPAARHGRDLPRDLEQRVVPRRDQAADADRLVDDPADHVGVAGVDDAARLLGGDPAVVAEDRDDVVDVVLRLRPAACPVSRDSSRASASLSRSMRSATAQQQVAALARGASAARGPSWKARCAAAMAAAVSSAPASSTSATRRAVGRAADLAAAPGAGRDPLPVDVELRHDPPTLRACVAYGATFRFHRNCLCL